MPTHIPGFILEVISCVTGKSIHVSRHRNSTYVQMFRRSIYEDKCPKQPHLPMRHCQQRPQGPNSRPRYMKSCPFHRPATSATSCTATSTVLCISSSITITASTALMRQDPSHLGITYPTLYPSSASAVPCWQPFPTGFDS